MLFYSGRGIQFVSASLKWKVLLKDWTSYYLLTCPVFLSSPFSLHLRSGSTMTPGLTDPACQSNQVLEGRRQAGREEDGKHPKNLKENTGESKYQTPAAEFRKISKNTSKSSRAVEHVQQKIPGKGARKNSGNLRFPCKLFLALCALGLDTAMLSFWCLFFSCVRHSFWHAVLYKSNLDKQNTPGVQKPKHNFYLNFIGKQP